MMNSAQDNLTKNVRFSLDQIMLQAESSLLISGHTLDKFATDASVKNALGTLFVRDVHITLVFLNPYSSYSQAHENFHMLESGGSAHTQILRTIRFLQGIFEDFNRPNKFEVFLTNYMPRFRAIIVDEHTCYVNLYLYGRDVSVTPEILITKQAHSSWFEAIQNSLHQMLGSNDVIPLIKTRFNDNWSNIRAVDILNRCLEANCCRGQSSSWSTAEAIILGYQNNSPEMALELGICSREYKPGTFTIDLVTPATQFLKSPMMFDEWIDKVLNDEFELIQSIYPDLFRRYPQHRIRTNVKAVLDSCRVGGVALKHRIWYQEYSDIIRRLIVTFLAHNPDFELDTHPNLTYLRRDLVIDVLSWLEKYKKPGAEDWLHLSIAAGLMGVNEKPSHMATSRINTVKAIMLDQIGEERGEAIQRVGSELWDVAKSPCRIDATAFFFGMLESSRYGFKLVSFLDDYLESIVMLKYYEELLKRFSSLEIHCVPRSIRCGNDITYEDIRNLLDHFPYLQTTRRFQVAENGPKIGGVNLLKLHPNIMRLIYEASALEVRGARSYEMMQGINKEVYFGFMVCREFSESVTGLFAEDRPFIFLHQAPGECSFEGFQLRHLRQDRGRMLAQVTVNDRKKKWEGGNTVHLVPQTDSHKARYSILRWFYSARAPEFHSKFGGSLEVEVKDFLNTLTGRVLVIGCGSGKEVEYLFKKGCDAFGFDFSTDAIALGRQEYPHLKSRLFVEDLYNLDIVMSGEFDGIVANAVLVHLLDREHISLILKKIWDRLKKDGLCFVRVIDKDNAKEEFDKNLFGELRWFVYYTLEEVKSLADEAGFVVEKTDRSTHAMYHNVHWVSILLRKPAEKNKHGMAQDIQLVSPSPSPGPGETNVISILFLAADPTDATRLRLGEELREIQEKFQLAKLRNRFELHQRMSIRPADVSQAMLDVQPKIVHFSGHGTTTGTLCFEDQGGKTHHIQPDALAALFEQFADQVNCVVLNACYSEVQANAIARQIDYVVGMNQAIDDKTAIAFSIGFYQALGAGRTVEQAYKLGCVQIRLQGIPEHLTPVLIKRGQT